MYKIDLISRTIIIICLSNSLYADVISPRVQAAQDRINTNPNVYDRVDSFCSGKKPYEACMIGGPVISGGGEGMCSNEPTDSDTIDLRCIRTKYVEIERDIPDGEMKSDRFCKGKKVGNPCKIEFVYDHVSQTAAGTCKMQIETRRYYYQGYHHESRNTVQCQPEPLPERIFTPVSFIKKLTQ